MRKYAATFLLAAAALFQGCDTLEDLAKDPAAQVMIRSALRVTSYLVVSKNPDLAPFAADIASLLAHWQNGTEPQAVRTNITNEVDRIAAEKDLTAEDRLLLISIIDEALILYERGYAAYQGEEDPAIAAEMDRLLKSMGKAIDDAINLVTDTATAAPPGATVVKLDRVTVQYR